VSDEPEVYDCTDFPHSQQFFLVEREVERHQRGDISHSTDIAYGVTSLKKGQVSAERLLELNRGHWEIENRVHYVRDVTYDEDRCRIRAQNGPRMMASIRNLAISISRLMGFRYLPDAIRHFTFCTNRKQTMVLWGIW
jgi:predicted transposase YbfD/YdcC